MSLFERGPLDPVDVEAATVLGPRTTFAGDAATLAQQLGAARGAISSAASVMTTAWTSRVEMEAGGDLAAAADAHDRQVRDFDSSIGAVAGNAEAHVGEIAGLSNDTAADIAAGEPDFPGYVDHPIPGLPDRPGTVPDPELTPPPREAPPPPGGGLYDYVALLYRDLLDRDGSDDEIQGWVNTGLSAQAIRDAFLDSPEYHEKHGG